MSQVEGTGDHHRIYTEKRLEKQGMDHQNGLGRVYTGYSSTDTE